MGSRTADGDDALLDMLTSRISNVESLLGRMAASTVRNDNFRKEDPTEFSGLLHCGRNIDVRKSYDYCASDKPSMYNIVINDGECMLPEEHYATRGGELDALLCRAWGEATLADVRAKVALLQDRGGDLTCANVGLPTDGHTDLSSHMYETVLKTKIPELVAVGKGGCVVRGRSNSTIAELLAIVIHISSALGYAEDFVCLVELERVPAYEGLVAAIARRNLTAMQSEYDALSKNAKAHAQRYEFCHDCGIVWR